MDNPLIFAVICLIFGCVVAVQVPRRLHASGEGLVGRVFLALMLLSLMTFLLSLGGAGIALAARWAGPAYVFEGVAVVSGFALLGIALLAALYGLIRFFVRRAAGAGSR